MTVLHKLPSMPAVAGVILFCLCAANIHAGGRFERLSETDVEELRVESAIIDVEVYGRSGSAVDGWAEDLPDNVVVEYRRYGGVLHVWVEQKFTLFPRRNDGKLVFQVPRDTNLEIGSSTGTISVQDMDADSVRAGSSTGVVRLSEIRGKTEAESSTGSLFLDRIEGPLQARSTSGRIEAAVLSGDLKASTSSGSIRLSQIDGDINISSSSGRIELDTTRGIVRAETSSGGINGDDVWLTGDSTFITSSGGIDVDLANPLSVFHFRLTGSSGSLRAGELTGTKSLEAGTGSILVTGHSSSGSQRYR